MALTALNFPASPTVGQIYPDPPVTGQPSYRWDGGQWLAYRTAPLLPAYSAPFDALAYSGMQINGSMEVSQENGVTGISVASGTTKYIVDGWQLTSNGTQVMTGNQNPSLAPPGFSAALQIYPTTANASPAVTHYTGFFHAIEGYRISRLAWGTANAQPITIGFWVYANRTGSYSGSVFNVVGTRSYPFAYTVNAVTTWEYKTVTIPGCIDGAWNKGNTSGITLSLMMMVGSTYTAPAGAWATGTFFGANGAINGVATTADYLLVTGVVVLPGIEAPTAAQSPLIMRPFDQELVTCQRYYYRRIYPTLNGYVAVLQAFTTTQAGGSLLDFPVSMRAAPATTANGAFSLTSAGGSTFALSGGTASSVTTDHAQISAIIGSASLVVGNATILMATTVPASHNFDARL